MRLTANGSPSIVKSIFGGAIAFAALWYFYFASSIVLRPLPYLFWAGMAGLSLASWIIFSGKLLKIDLWFFGGMIVIWFLSVFGLDMYSSLSTLANYLIYYLVARMIAEYNHSRTILKMILFFSLVHMVCMYIQVFAPDVYKSVFLPLLPEERHIQILEQMEYNEAYYGFAIQSSMSAMYLSVGAVLSAVQVSCAKKIAKKALYAVLLVLLSVAMLLTVRRGSIAVLLLILFLMFIFSKGKATTKIAVAVGAVLLVMLIGVESIPGLKVMLDKIGTYADKGNIMNGRDTTFMKALLLFVERPVFGFGLGQIEAALGYAWLENSYLVMLVECGLIGSIIYYIPYGMMLRNTWSSFLKKYKENVCVAFSFYVQVLFMAMSMVENYLAAPSTVFLLFTVVFSGYKAIKEDHTVTNRGSL